MASTPKRHYPYSGLQDQPDGPHQIEALAESIDPDVQQIDDRLKVVENDMLRVYATVVSQAGGIAQSSDGTMRTLTGANSTWSQVTDTIGDGDPATSNGFSESTGTYTVPAGKNGWHYILGRVGIAAAAQSKWVAGSILRGGSPLTASPVVVNPGAVQFGDAPASGLAWGVANALTAAIPLRPVNLAVGESIQMAITGACTSTGPFDMSSGTAVVSYLLILTAK